MVKMLVAVPDLFGNQEKYAVQEIRSTWISSIGPFVDSFEKEFTRLRDLVRY
jgi:perosamine synthetase